MGRQRLDLGYTRRFENFHAILENSCRFSSAIPTIRLRCRANAASHADRPDFVRVEWRVLDGLGELAGGRLCLRSWAGGLD